MNRYYGNTGRRERLPEPAAPPPPPPAHRKPPRSEPDRGGRNRMDLSSLLRRFSLSNLEQEDLLLLAVVYLLYRESGDPELLITLGALLFL